VPGQGGSPVIIRTFQGINVQEEVPGCWEFLVVVTVRRGAATVLDQGHRRLNSRYGSRYRIRPLFGFA
jgi:hypothetical protein